uniref:Uncharacterized protein n=1 Tax=Candidatus Kentrum sp. FM TaxID=2126340 RepID=A0A450S7C8_9GAMM|nr:MAG: hypothetical protein BECKFM1743A_GA0114220_1005110 [Candidatus Kentron sp. FM]VFJ48855.1 MAG: hypothetical protein BECKFM1743C_GA0114222_100646 [Candidatus Kentron sp. FM]
MSLFVPLCLCGSPLQSLSISVAAWLRYVLCGEESFFSLGVFRGHYLSSPRWRIRPYITVRLLLDSGLMADQCNYTSEIDMEARMLGANTGGDGGDGGEHKVRPYAPPNVGANLVFAHYA